MKIYHLVAHSYCFNGTDHESSRNSRILAISKNINTINEVKAKICGKGFGFNANTSPYMKACVEYYATKYEIRKNLPTQYDLKLDNGRIVKIDFIHIDDYYGEGDLNDIFIESSDYLDPEDFI